MNEAQLIEHEEKKQQIKNFVDTFGKEILSVFNMQEDALWEQTKQHAQYIGTIAVFIKIFGRDNQISIPVEVLKDVEDIEFYVRVNKEDDMIAYSLVFEEAPNDADTNGRENLQAEV